MIVHTFGCWRASFRAPVGDHSSELPRGSSGRGCQGRHWLTCKLKMYRDVLTSTGQSDVRPPAGRNDECVARIKDLIVIVISTHIAEAKTVLRDLRMPAHCLDCCRSTKPWKSFKIWPLKINHGPADHVDKTSTHAKTKLMQRF